MQKYNFNATAVRDSGDFKLDPKCNGITAINKGDSIVSINGIELKPFPPGHPELSGESISIGGNEGEILVGNAGRLTVVFNALPGVSPLLVVVQKYFIN